MTTIAYSYRLGISTVRKIIVQVCKAMWLIMKPIYLPEPTRQHWKNIEAAFERRWQFPNCLGAIDGKHVTIMKPAHSASLYINYKQTFSIVLMAIVDAVYNFIAVDVGAIGSNSDAGIFRKCAIGKRILTDRICSPNDKPLPTTATPVPHVFVGDEAFPLRYNLLRPFPGKGGLNDQQLRFNYRLSRARRIVENGFGILSQRFRIYHRRMICSPQVAKQVVLATVVLHNYLTSPNDKLHNYVVENPNMTKDFQKQAAGLFDLAPTRGNRGSTAAMEVRNRFMHFFSGVGYVDWQDESCSIGTELRPQ